MKAQKYAYHTGNNDSEVDIELRIEPMPGGIDTASYEVHRMLRDSIVWNDADNQPGILISARIGSDKRSNSFQAFVLLGDIIKSFPFDDVSAIVYEIEDNRRKESELREARVSAARETVEKNLSKFGLNIEEIYPELFVQKKGK